MVLQGRLTWLLYVYVITFKKKYVMKKRLGLLLVVLLFMSSCASILTGTKDTIRFDSKPQGATIYIDGLEVCKTPCVTKVKRSLSEKLVEIKLENFETRVIALDRTFNAVSVLNMFGLIGWGIDAATGSLMRYDRKGYDIELKEKGITASIDDPIRIEIDTENQLVDIFVMQ